MDDLSALMPEMPARCFSCGNWFELNDMYGCSANCDNEVRCRACDRRHTDDHGAGFCVDHGAVNLG